MLVWRLRSVNGRPRAAPPLSAPLTIASRSLPVQRDQTVRHIHHHQRLLPLHEPARQDNDLGAATTRLPIARLTPAKHYHIDARSLCARRSASAEPTPAPTRARRRANEHAQRPTRRVAQRRLDHPTQSIQQSTSARFVSTRCRRRRLEVEHGTHKIIGDVTRRLAGAHILELGQNAHKHEAKVGGSGPNRSPPSRPARRRRAPTSSNQR